MDRRWMLVPLVGAVSLLPACGQSERGTALIQGTQPGSKISGTATFIPTANGLKVSVQVAHVPPGLHGLHIHEGGSCGQGGASAGGHFNPHQVKHGFLPRDGLSGAHAGDFGNITVGSDGTGTVTLTLPGLTLHEGPHSVAGRSIILHEKPDDFSQPTGNAGARIGCGLVTVNR